MLTQGNSSMKKGVSLVIVLLLMLVATIAATATYKWLNSSGRTSSSRMLQNTAYQSAVAGIENTRTWMTYHASDVGSLIKQYITGGNKPILLNNQLKELTRAGQEFNVWLVGVNTENSTYKLKIISSGKASNNTEYNLAAIFNVDGLYRVKIPQVNTSSKINFDYAYFASSYHGAGDVTMQSAVINGNWSGNPQSVTGNLIVTGNATLSGNNVNVGELACIGGNMTIGNQGIKAKDVYVNGSSINARMTVEGDAFLNGPVTQGSTGELHYKGNLTLNNTLSTNQSGGSYWVKVDKNLCMSETARIVSNGTNASLEVVGNVWMPGDVNLVYKDFTDNSNVYDKIIIGSDETSIAYIKSARASSTYSQFNTKSYTETGKQHCPTRFEIFNEDGTASTYNWISQTDGHYIKAANATGSYVCGTVDEESYKRDGYQYVNYTRGWQDWSGNSHSGIFPSVTAADKKYYMSDFAGSADDFVTFDVAYTLDDWRVHKVIDVYDKHLTDISDKTFAIPIYINDFWGEHKFGQRFTEKPNIGVYKIKGVPYYDPTTNGNTFYNYASNKPTGSPYCYYDGSTDGAYRPACKVPIWFKSNATVSNDMDPANKPHCAEDVLDHCNAIWHTGTGCDGSSFVVNDPLSTGFNNFSSFATKGCAANITKWSDLSKATSCYNTNVSDDEKKKTDLYNGYLVVNITDGGGENCNNYSLDGKFIIIADSKISCQNGLPKTTDDSFVFMYLKNGASKIGSTNKHYFIYTLGQIDDMPGGPKLTGTLYSPASLCKGVGSIQSATFTVDKPLLEDLANAAVICNNDGTNPTCTYGVDYGGSSSSAAGGGSSSSGGVVVQEIQLGGTDSYYISNAPTLSISIESQYKTDETLPTANQVSEITQDFIVVPRVIYMPTDPYGTLDDYYNVIGLNGLSISKSEGSVTCSGPTPIKTSGPLYNHAGGDTKLANNGRYQCTFTAKGRSVPFYIIAKGESGNTPFISFTEQFVKMGGSATYDVKINVPAHAAVLPVKIIKPANIDNWTITPQNGGSCTGNECTFNLAANASYSEVTVFRVTTASATSGTAMFQLDAGEGYIIEPPSTITLSLSSAITVTRVPATTAQIDEFCTDNDDCPTNTSNWPDCPTSASWVKASPNCYTTSTNQSWSCGIADDVTLVETTPPAGCVIIIPPSEKIAKESIVNGESYELHASIKAKLLQFYFGFAGTNISGKTLTARITESADNSRVGITSSCTYGTTITATNQRCSLNVFSGEKVSVTVNNGSRPENFNYWQCTGSNCPAETNSGVTYPAFSITSSNNTVIAHFDEKDKHCFFDEFDTGVGCTGAYCISPTGSKWHSADGNKLDYQNGYVTVTENRTDKTEALVMSTADVGLVGTLVAQFMVPQMPQSSKSQIPEKIRNTGFILRSNSVGSIYLLMNVYADKEGYLAIQICDEAGNYCRVKNPTNGSSKLNVSSSTMVTLNADLTMDNISVGVMTNRLGVSSNYTASFSFTDGLENYRDMGSSIGFRIADPSFKLYDIGWKSETYGSQCWDTPPTVNCSFRSAYAGGFVPKDTNVTPWVGLSSWFDTRNCEPHYFYKGDDEANSCGTSSDYGECISGYYKFSAAGAHGITDASDNEIRTAKAGVGNCYYLDEPDALLAASALGHCGAFWVGELTPCSQHVYFAGANSKNDTKAVYAGSPESFNLSSGANVREANLVLDITNSGGLTVEVALKSQENSSAPVYYSRPFITTGSGEMSVDIQSLLDIDGFDPQDVFGVEVSVSGASSYDNVTVNAIYTSCPNVASITCGQDMRYNTLTGKWELNATVTPFSKVETFVISENNSWLSNATYDCSTPGCNYVENGKMGTYSFEMTDNPYGVDPPHTGSSYPHQFTVELTTTEKETLSCETNAWTVPAIQGTCGSLSTAKVKAGLGLPQFTYNVSNCPESGCTYNITLDDDGSTLIKSSTGNVVNGATASDAANSATAPLAVGTYKFKLVSTDANAPFEGCESSEFRVVDLADDYDVTCGVSSHHWEIYGGPEFFSTDHLYFMAKNNVRTEETIDGVSVYKDNTSEGTTTITNWSNLTTAKDIGTLTKGTYKYSLKIANVEICSQTITIKDAGDDVTAICNNVTAYKGQSASGLVSMPKPANITSSTRTIKIGSETMSTSTNCNKDYCEDMPAFTAPSTVGSYTYDFYFEGDKKCSGTLTVIDPVDEVTATCANVSTYPGQNTGSLVTLQHYSHVVSQVPLTIKIGSDTKATNTCDQYNCPNGGMSFNAPSSISGSPYTYKLFVDGKEKCSGTITVNDVLSCSATPTNVTLGNSFVFTTTYASSECWNSSLTSNSDGNGLPSNITQCQSSYTITPATIGTKTYTYSVTNGRIGTGSCSVEVNVAEEAPVITAGCPTSAVSIEKGSSMTLPLTVTGCTSPAGCNYAVTKGSTTLSGAVTNKSYHGTTTGSFTPTEEGEHTFTVTNSATNTAGTNVCKFNVSFKKPEVTCSGTYNVEPTGTVSFPATIDYCNPSTCSYSVKKDGNVVSGTSPSFNGTNASFTTEATTGTVSYTFHATNSAGKSDYCTMSVAYLAPTLTCPDDPYSVEPGTNVPFIPATFGNCSKGCNYSLVYDDDPTNYHWENTTSWSYNSRAQVSFPRAAGLTSNEYTFTVTNQGGATASCHFKANYAVPSYDCPDNLTNKPVKASIPVSLTPDYCTQGCKYKVTTGSATGTEVYSIDAYSYTGGDLPNITSTNSPGSNSAGTISYYVTLTNPAGSPATPCHFDVTYVSNACTESTQTISGGNFQLNVNGFTNGCYKINTVKGCKKAQVQSSGSVGTGTFTINGTSITCGTYFDNIITQMTEMLIEVPSTCTLKGSIYLDQCSKVIDPNNFEITWDAAAVEAGSYTVKSLVSGCKYARFNCPGSVGCSVAVNTSDPVSGGAYSSNIIISPKPEATDVLTVVGSAQIFCTNW